MRYVAAYLLAALGGNEKPSESDVKKILSSVGVDADSDCVKKVIGELQGKNLEELMDAGRKKMASMPSASAVAAPAASQAASKAEPAKETKKEEPKEEEEEDDADMGFGLFD